MSATPLQSLYDDARGLMADTDAVADVDDTIFRSVLPAALADFSRWSPRLKPTELSIAAGDTLVDLPADFIEIDVASFNRAVNPRNLPFTYRSYVYAFMSQTSASSDLPTYFTPNIVNFEAWTTFRFIDGDAGRQMWIQPQALREATLSFLYKAVHSVTDSSSTVPEAKRDLLVLKLCAMSCRALARQLAGDKFLNPHYSKLYECFNEDYEERTRFQAVGIAG